MPRLAVRALCGEGEDARSVVLVVMRRLSFVTDHFYKTGEMVAGEYGRRLHFPLLKIFAQYLFWFVMVYVHYRVYGSIVRWFVTTLGF